MTNAEHADNILFINDPKEDKVRLYRQRSNWPRQAGLMTANNIAMRKVFQVINSIKESLHELRRMLR
jgi:hypothetical protein